MGMLTLRRQTISSINEGEGRGMRARILVIDDDLALNRLLSLSLEEEGFAVRSAFDGLRALQLLEQEDADAVVLDLHMPGMDGRAFYHELRQSKRSGIPVVLVSAHGASRARTELGAEASLEKPFDFVQLLDILVQLTTTRGEPGG